MASKRPSRSRLRTACLAATTLFASTAVAQNSEEQPLSAIDWLSRSVETPIALPLTQPDADPTETPVAQSGTAPSVTTTSLDAPSADVIGLLSPNVTGLPRNLWSGSDQSTLISLIQADQVENLPAIQDLMVSLLLAEAAPPGGAGPDAMLFQARIDKLLDIGALDPAQAMLEAAGPDTPELYRRWFDISLLTGTEDAACAAQITQPNLDPTFPARIFCLARNGDWTAAALTLGTARALGHVSAEEDMLISYFLEPELTEDAEELPPPSRPSPLVFRMREAIGQGLTTAGLPRAFAHADLRDTVAWRYQMQAAERLVRTGAVSDNTLLGFYTARTPAASGGVWDRAKAIQSLVSSLETRDDEDLPATLNAAWQAMQDIRAETVFARLFAPTLLEAGPTGETARIAYRIGLLAPDYAEHAAVIAPVTRQERLWQAIATGQNLDQSGQTPAERAVIAAFEGANVPETMQSLLDNGQIGEALLRSIGLFEQGMGGDTDAITDALSVLLAMGLEDTARRAALQYLILDRPS